MADACVSLAVSGLISTYVEPPGSARRGGTCAADKLQIRRRRVSIRAARRGLMMGSSVRRNLAFLSPAKAPMIWRMPVMSFDARGTISGANQCVNTFHVFVPSQPTAAEANSILTPVKTFFDAIAAYRVIATTSVIGTRVLYWQEAWWTKPIGISGKPGYVPGKFNTEPLILGATPANAIAGTGGNAIPPQLAMVVSWRSVVSGRSGRGRTYLGNLSANGMNNANVASACVTAVNGAAAALITNLRAVSVSGTPAYLCVWSPTKGVTREILSGATDATYDTMRSRVK